MEYQVGDYVRILRKPRSWTSEFSFNCPLNEEGDFWPFEGEITDLAYNYHDRLGYHPAKIGNYGFSLEDLIKEDNIKLIPNPTIKKESYKYLTKLFKKLKIK